MMFRRVYRLAVLAAVVLVAGVAFAAGSNDVLYWMVDENAKVDKWWMSQSEDNPADIKDYLGSWTKPGGLSDDSYFAARVRVKGGNLTEDTFLQLYYRDEYDNPHILDGGLGISIEDDSDYWGAGVPTGNQSPSGDYSAGSPEYSFIVELGNVDGGEWTTIATSEASTYSDLSSDYIKPAYDMTPSALQIWTPAVFTAVPEPSGGLLTALGLALLALRRKRLDKGV